MTGYPSIDKPWLKYFQPDAINASLPECTVFEYLKESNKNYPTDVAINYFDKLIKYEELFFEVDRCAKSLTALGLEKGDIIIMSTVTTPEAIYAFYACDLLGIIPNMVDPRTSTEGIRHYIEEVNSRCVITIDVAFPKIVKAAAGTSVEKIIAISPADSLKPVMRKIYLASNRIKGKAVKLPDSCDTWATFIKRGESETYVPVPYQQDRCCVIVHTGGTTGTPKGVMLSDQNLNTMAMQYRLLGVEFNRTQRFLNIMPPFIAYGIVCGIHMPLVLGLIDVLIPQLDPNKFANLIKKYKPAHMLGVPAHFEKLRTSPLMKGFDLSFFESTGAGGDSISAQFERDINEFLKEHNSRYAIAKGYGMTEISSAAAASHGNVNKFMSAGIPHLKTVISIFKPGTDIELKYGETGEICMSAPTVMLGYYNQPEVTSDILRVHKDGKKWIHSGDIGYMDEDGFLFIKGRIKRMIVRHDGFKVFPSLIENVISSHSAVQQCCVVGKKDAEHSQGDIPIAFVQLKQEKEQDQSAIESELSVLCVKELPEYAQPAEWHFLSELPLTPIGKVDYRAMEHLQ